MELISCDLANIVQSRRIHTHVHDDNGQETQRFVQVGVESSTILLGFQLQHRGRAHANESCTELEAFDCSDEVLNTNNPTFSSNYMGRVESVEEDRALDHSLGDYLL